MRLEGFHCETHGDVFARDRRWGPCPKCEAEERAQKIAAAKARVAKFDELQVLRAEVAVLRAALLHRDAHPDRAISYWNDVAKILEAGA